MAPMPHLQRVFKITSWIVLGAISVGALLDAISNAVAIITPFLTVAGTVLIALAWAGIQVSLRWRPTMWQTANGTRVRLRSLGSATTATLIGAILLLWAPRIRDAYVVKEIADPSLPSKIRSLGNAADTSADTPVPEARVLQPSLEISIVPSSIRRGEVADIKWSIRNAQSAFLMPRVGFVPPQGSLRVSPERTTTYLMAAMARDGTAVIRQSTLEVDGASSSVSVSAVEAGVTYRKLEPPRLDWSSVDATEIAIVPVIGFVSGAGQMDVFPKETTRFTVIGSNPTGGYSTARVTVEVLRWPNPVRSTSERR